MVRRKISRKRPGYMRAALWFVLLAIIAVLVVAVKMYRTVFLPAVDMEEGERIILYLPPEADYEWLMNRLDREEVIKDRMTFEWVAKKKQLDKHISPGRYVIEPGMNNNEIINKIRSGNQDPVIFLFNNLRSLEELAGVAAGILEPDSSEFAEYLTSPNTAKDLGFSPETFPSMFIPNSYEFYWTTDPEEFAERMKREYIAFWSKGREQKAKELGLTREEVSVLASIVEQEALHPEENIKIAGVFINRLEKGIPLQSDPTLIYALQNFNIRRVLNNHKLIDSPYNTYKNRGLPPGPINIPSIAAIDGVLNYEKHNYIYFCAKPDFSGYHNFSRTLSQHNKNARLYQQALNRRKIYR
ncbi:MAG: endolytic transglycosylase MltG [Bacteroidota bacterium]